LAKNDLIQVRGTVTNVWPGGDFTVRSDLGHDIRARLSGRIRRNYIRVVLGDRVTVGVSPYDPTRGLILYRD
jgi:translation initiation factor IF-1